MCHLYPFVSYEFGSVGFMAEINQAIALRTIKSFYCRSSQLVGGLEHFFIFPYIGNSNPN